MTPFDTNCRHTLDGRLDAKDPRQFEEQLLRLVRKAEQFVGLVYVWHAFKPIPRLKSCSEVVYVGKTRYSLHDRYTRRNVHTDTETFWLRLLHIIEQFGPIRIDVYPVDDPDQSENDFLFDYHMKHFESPPLNNSNFKWSRISADQRRRFYETVGDPGAA